MKKSLLLFLPVLLLPLFVQAQADTIFYEDFDGGIPDTWTIGPGTPEGAVWQWSADGRAANAQVDGNTVNALFWGMNPAIGSPTVGNGVAMYNSDVYDGGGTGVGQGPFPGVHSGTLTSPAIDCSELDTVFISFFQYARANASAISTLLEVSADTGQTWVNIPINPTVVGNGSTPADNLLLANISEVAANQPHVQIRFVWNGRYYFWLIDDVQIIPPVDQELILGDIFYAPASYATPVSQIATDTFGFSADISNIGAKAVTNLVLKASIFERIGDDQLELLYADSLVVAEFPAFAEDSTLVIEDLYVPELPVGNYVLRYDVYSLDGEDFNPRNNSKQENFVISEGLFSKEAAPASGVRPGTIGDYQMGNYYRMSPLSGNEFVISTVSFSGTKNAADGPIEGDQTTIFLYRVSDDVDASFDNFDTSLETEDLEVIGFAFYTFGAGEENQLITIELTDIDLNPIQLEPGARYFLMAEWANESNLVFAGVNNSIDYFQISTITRTSEWFLGGFGPSRAAVMRMAIELRTTADEQPLPEQSMNIFPNPIPVNDQLNVQLDLEERMPAMLVVADLSGRVISVQEYPDGLQNETLQVSTSQFPAGTYLVRLRTDAGTKTMKFNVIR